MQTSPFDPAYPHHLQHHHATGAYGSMPGFESAGIKFHHGGYADATSDAAAAAFYQNYVNPTQDYAPREPPTYAESTTTATSSALFHPGFMPTSAADYYKLGNGGGGVVGVNGSSLRQMDMSSEYYGVPKTAAMTDNFLMKQESVGVGNSCSESEGHLLDYNTARYSRENLHQLQHHQQQLQQQQQQQQQQPQHHHQHHLHLPHQRPKPQMQMTPELIHTDSKPESETHPDYKTPTDINTVATSNMGGLQQQQHQLQQQQQQQQQTQEEHPELPPTLAGDVPALHSQSPSSEETPGEGSEPSQETETNTSATTETSPAQEGANTGEGGEGEDQGKTTNEVKPTLSYIALIAKSILESPQRRLNLGSIYGWIEKNYPYYLNRGQGWRNSVRHNLSLNDCFIKAGRCEDGKGNYWAIHPANMQDFLRGDFRQRRRSRRRGRKKDCELGMYHHHHQFTNGYLGAATASGVAAAAAAAAGSSLGVGGFAAPAATMYSPYTEAERRAYRLDEALLRQSMNNPFLKWYHQSSGYPAATSPSAVNSGVYSGVGSVAGVGGVAGSGSQWTQTYPENSGQGVYPLNSTFSR
ncbi:uncharacterized protein [Littorina saxatilis]|uniref:uncharacterized protein n=1 Tax=Littorina saxatilis TaxID=31220 RepID=UPI0038B42C0E